MAHDDRDREYGGRDEGYRGGGVNFGMGMQSAPDDESYEEPPDPAVPDTTGSEGGGTKMPRALR